MKAILSAAFAFSLLASACGPESLGSVEQFDETGSLEQASKGRGGDADAVASGESESEGGDAKGGACEGGGYSIIFPNGRVIRADFRGEVSASELGSSFLVKGKYIEFEVDSASFGVRNWTLTGAPNEFDLTNGRRTVVYTSKMPDHGGRSLTSELDIRLDTGNVVLSREGSDFAMKIQAKDCAEGGIFQMEPEREDGRPTPVTHILHPDVFFYDNPNFRNRNGETFQYDATTVLTITPRVNFGSDLSSSLVGRDSPQVATRVQTNCVNAIPNANGTTSNVNHCGGRSDWLIQSGGRMGQVMGEDAVALEPAQPACTENCQVQSQIQGQGLILGFPSPVPAAYRFSPRG